MYKSLLAALALTLALSPMAEAKQWRDPAKLDLASAEQSLSKGGPAIKVLFSNSGAPAFMAGGFGAGYLSENFYLGGAGFGGTFAQNGEIAGGLGYGGMVVGMEKTFGEATLLDLNLLVGGGGGGATAEKGNGSFVIEPNLSLSRNFGEGFRGGIQVGYLYMPTANNFSGITAGLNLTFKSLTLVFPMD